MQADRAFLLSFELYEKFPTLVRGSHLAEGLLDGILINQVAPYFLKLIYHIIRLPSFTGGPSKIEDLATRVTGEFHATF